MVRFFVLIQFVIIWAMALAGEYFTEGYAEGVTSQLMGDSYNVIVRSGIRSNDTDVYFNFRSDWYDTTGTDLPFQYTARGTSLGVGVSQRILGGKAKVSATVGRVVDGPNQDHLDLRAGLAGYNSWEKGRGFNDLYGELFWVDRAEDYFFNMRYRPGITLHRDKNGRLWTYLATSVWASGKGENGSENRVEGGVGIGYLLGDKITVNLDYRVGHVFSGTISSKDYANPTFVIAGNF